jgi:hypothetical protein
MIIKRYASFCDDIDFKLDIHIVSKFLYADMCGLYFLVDDTTKTQEREFYPRWECYPRFKDGERSLPSWFEVVHPNMTFLTTILSGEERCFLFWNR